MDGARELFEEGRVLYINIHFSQLPACPFNANDTDYSSMFPKVSI